MFERMPRASGCDWRSCRHWSAEQLPARSAPALRRRDPAEEAQPAAEAAAPEGSEFQEAVGAILAEETTETAVESASEEAPPAEPATG